MNYFFKISFQSFVKSFYRENAGAFVFVFTIMFFIVNKVDGAGLYEYHYSLATGMLKSNIFLFLVFFIWFLYVRKCMVFVSGVITDPHYNFLQVYNQVSKIKRLRLFFTIEILLLMPVLLYAIFIAFVGLQQHLYTPVLSMIGYLLLLPAIAAQWHVYQLDNLNKKPAFSLQKPNRLVRLFPFYPFTLIRFVITKQINIWLGIKIFTCGTLYLISRNNDFNNYDISIAFLFYNVGILANGVLVFRIRRFEETFLGFYRSIPVPLIKRFLQYSLVYAVFLIPEFITAFVLAPVHLHLNDAIGFILSGFSLLLLMNSLAFLEDFTMRDYIKVLLAVFFVEYIFMITVGSVFLYVSFFILALIIFLERYYKLQQIWYD